MSSTRSVATTAPSPPTARAMVIMGSPAPEARSSTRMPGPMPAASTSGPLKRAVMRSMAGAWRSHTGARAIQ